MGSRDVRGGALDRAVEAGSSADQVGIKAGDVIIEADGRQLRNSADLRNSIALVPIGDIVELTLLRDGRRMTVRARLGKAQAASLSAGGGKFLEVI